jgi:hypothetical protein
MPASSPYPRRSRHEISKACNLRTIPNCSIEDPLRLEPTGVTSRARNLTTSRATAGRSRWTARPRQMRVTSTSPYSTSPSSTSPSSPGAVTRPPPRGRGAGPARTASRGRCTPATSSCLRVSRSGPTRPARRAARGGEQLVQHPAVPEARPRVPVPRAARRARRVAGRMPPVGAGGRRALAAGTAAGAHMPARLHAARRPQAVLAWSAQGPDSLGLAHVPRGPFT